MTDYIHTHICAYIHTHTVYIHIHTNQTHAHTYRCVLIEKHTSQFMSVFGKLFLPGRGNRERLYRYISREGLGCSAASRKTITEKWQFLFIFSLYFLLSACKSNSCYFCYLNGTHSDPAVFPEDRPGLSWWPCLCLCCTWAHWHRNEIWRQREH